MSTFTDPVSIRLRLLSRSRAQRGLATITDFLDQIGDRRDHAFDIKVGKATAAWYRRVNGREPATAVTYSREGRPITVNAYRVGQFDVIAAGYLAVCATA